MKKIWQKSASLALVLLFLFCTCAVAMEMSELDYDDPDVEYSYEFRFSDTGFVFYPSVELASGMITDDYDSKSAFIIPSTNNGEGSAVNWIMAELAQYDESPLLTMTEQDMEALVENTFGPSEEQTLTLYYDESTNIPVLCIERGLPIDERLLSAFDRGWFLTIYTTAYQDYRSLTEEEILLQDALMKEALMPVVDSFIDSISIPQAGIEYTVNDGMRAFHDWDEEEYQMYYILDALSSTAYFTITASYDKSYEGKRIEEMTEEQREEILNLWRIGETVDSGIIDDINESLSFAYEMTNAGFDMQIYATVNKGWAIVVSYMDFGYLESDYANKILHDIIASIN